MIQFDNLSQEEPYLIFKNKYDESLKAGQKTIEAISISSYSPEKKMLHSQEEAVVGRPFLLVSQGGQQRRKECRCRAQFLTSSGG